MFYFLFYKDALLSWCFFYWFLEFLEHYSSTGGTRNKGGRAAHNPKGSLLCLSVRRREGAARPPDLSFDILKRSVLFPQHTETWRRDRNSYELWERGWKRREKEQGRGWKERQSETAGNEVQLDRNSREKLQLWKKREAGWETEIDWPSEWSNWEKERQSAPGSTQGPH